MSGLRLSPLDFDRYKEMPHGFDPWGISLFGHGACPEMPQSIVCSNVPKRPKLWAGIILARQTDRQDGKAMLFPSPARECDTLRTRNLRANRSVIHVSATRSRASRR